MRWYFRDISDDPSEKELTQQDQFNNDEVALAEAIVRETIQNSTDAHANRSAPVRVRFAINLIEETDRAFFNKIIDGLLPHLRACKMPIPDSGAPLRALVIEDFETSGLTGSVEIKDNGQFSGFWRRFGRSNKEGSKGGRWGLGKLVFTSASSLHTVMGLTRRVGDNASWVMGQAILRNHAINQQEKDSVGFWCDEAAARPGLPTKDLSLAESLSRTVRLRRKSEPGLSLVVPALLPDIEPSHLVVATVKNYYFPILTGRLIVEVDELEISAKTFESICGSLPNEQIAASLLAFVRLLQARGTEPMLTLPPAWQREGLSTITLGDDATEMLRERYKAGELLSIRAPLKLQTKDNSELDSYIDLFLKQAVPGERVQTLVVRGSITVPTEGKKINLPDSHAALIATHDAISKLLGDAENPAHTQWNERADKLKLSWESGSSVLRRVRASLRELYALVAERVERDDPLALLEFFSIPKSDRDGGPRPTVSRLENLPPPTPRPFRIEKRAGGFAILPDGGIPADQLPLQIQVRCAYDVLSGNPYKRYSEYDFSFFQQKIRFTQDNAHCMAKPGSKGNELDIAIYKSAFKIEVAGFDPNRDLIVEALAL